MLRRRTLLLSALALPALSACASTLGAAGPMAPLPHDASSHARPDEARVRHISLDLAADFDRKVFHGTATLDIVARPDAREIVLDSDGLAIRAVRAGGRETAYELGSRDEKLGSALTIQLNGARQIEIEYESAPNASALQWLAPAQTASNKRFLFSQGQAIHNRSWIPTQDSPGIRQTYDARIVVPDDLKAVMSAEMLTPDGEPAGAGRRAFRFRMPQPIPPYLIAIGVGDLEFRAVGPRTGVWAEPSVVERGAYECADMERMMEVAEALYGPYRWGRYDVLILPPSFPYGGMENPRLTFLTPTFLAGDRSLVSLVAHELAHSWSGNLVTNAVWADGWLNEGFTSYIEGRIVEALYGAEFAEMELSLSLRELGTTVEEMLKEDAAGTILHANLEGKDPDDLVGPIAYDKGASFLRMLEARFGRERFDAFLKGYFQSHRFGNMTTGRFLEILKRDLFAGDEAAWGDAKVQEWVFEPGLPSNLVPARSERFARTLAAAEAFAKDGSLDLVKRDWSSPEWQDFVENLPRPMTPAQMQALDDAFAFSRAGNNEVRFDFLMHVARNAWEPGYAALEQFLCSLGRRKFLTPIYAALMEKESTAALARAIYAKARPTYHPIAVGTLDAVVK